MKLRDYEASADPEAAPGFRLAAEGRTLSESQEESYASLQDGEEHWAQRQTKWF